MPFAKNHRKHHIACGGVVRDGRLELPTSCSQSKRATNCANPGFLVIEFCSRCGQTCGQAVFLTISACGGSACIAGVSRDCGHGIFRLEGGATRSQSKRATNCANPGFLVIQFCARCGQTCGQAVFLTTSTCGGSACIAGVSRDCGHGIFRLEGGATRSQTRRDTNFAIPGYSISAIIPRQRGKSKIFLSVVIYVVKAAFMPFSTTGGNPANAGAARLCGALPCLVSDTATVHPKQACYQLR